MKIENNKTYIQQTEIMHLYGLNYNKAKLIMERGKNLKIFQIRITRLRVQRQVIHILQEEAEQILEIINQENTIKTIDNSTYSLHQGMQIIVGQYAPETPYIEHPTLNNKQVILYRRVDDSKNNKIQKWSIRKPQIDIIIYCAKRMIDCVVRQKKESSYINQIKEIIVNSLESKKTSKGQVLKLLQATKDIEQDRLTYMFHKIWIDLISIHAIQEIGKQGWMLTRNEI